MNMNSNINVFQQMPGENTVRQSVAMNSADNINYIAIKGLHSWKRSLNM